MLYNTVIEICLVERFYCITSNIELKHSNYAWKASLSDFFLWPINTHALEVFWSQQKKKNRFVSDWASYIGSQCWLQPRDCKLKSSQIHKISKKSLFSLTFSYCLQSALISLTSWLKRHYFFPFQKHFECQAACHANHYKRRQVEISSIWLKD